MSQPTSPDGTATPGLRRRALLGAAAAVPLALPSVARGAVTTLRFVPQANLTSLDPIWTTVTVTTNHGYYVYDTLYSVGADLVPRPQMARGHEVSGDGLTWLIRLRDGLRFHDDTPVRAQDCAASLARWAKRDGFGQILDSVTERWGARDDRTIEIKLKRPFPRLLTAIAKPDAQAPFMMPERIALTDPGKQLTEVIGSGPYRFIPGEYVTGSHVAYSRFDGYLPRDEPPDWASGAKVAHFDRVEWTVIPDPATAAAALQRGEVDWWEQPLTDLLPVLARAGMKTLIDQPAGRLAVLRLNALRPPFDDVRVRQAVMTAVRQDDYMRAAIGDDSSLWTDCRSLYPCDTPYAAEHTALMPGDMARAQAMLRASGYSGQRVVVLNPTDFQLIGTLGQVTADLLRRLGMNVDLQDMDWGSVIQRRSSRGGVDQGGWSAFHTFGNATTWSNPAASVIVRGQGAAGWFGWWDSPKVEELTREWLDASDPVEQSRLARAVGDLAMEDVATIPLGRFFVKTAYRPTITGILQGPSPFPWNVRPA